MTNDEFFSTQTMIYELAASPAFEQDGICFLAKQNGLFRSDDGGQCWHACFTSLNLGADIPATSLALSPNFIEDQTLFAGTSGGILRSTDGGDTWQITRTKSARTTVSALALSPHYAKDSLVLAGTLEDGVLCSDNGGERWTGWNFGLSDLQINSLALSPAFAQDGIAFIGTESGVFVSHNSGKSWQETAFPMAKSPVLTIALSPNFAHNGVAFAGTASTGVWKTNNCGESWHPHFSETGGSTQQIIFVSTKNESDDILILSDGQIFHSQNNRLHWRHQSNAHDSRSVAALATAISASNKAIPLIVLHTGEMIVLDIQNSRMR